MKDFDMAVSNFHKAVEIDPQNQPNRYSLRRALFDAELKSSLKGKNDTYAYYLD